MLLGVAPLLRIALRGKATTHPRITQRIKRVSVVQKEVTAWIAQLTLIPIPSVKYPFFTPSPKGPTLPPSKGSLKNESEKEATRLYEADGIIPPIHTPVGTKRPPCNCKKSKCLKLYCECFANNYYCEGCNCLACHNLLVHEPARKVYTSISPRTFPTVKVPQLLTTFVSVLVLIHE